MLVFSAATAMALQSTAGSVQTAIDADPTGNTATALGVQDNCHSAAVGDTFQVDVVVHGVPTYDEKILTGGTRAFGFNFHFDPKVVHVTAADNGIWLGSASRFEVIQANYDPGGDPNDFPATTGDTRIDYATFARFSSGDGVLTRLTLQAVGAGTSTLTINDEVDNAKYAEVIDAQSEIYPVSQQQDAVIAVGQPCTSVTTPAPTVPGEGPLVGTPSPSPAPTTTPAGPPATGAGDTAIAIDAVTTGNSATELGPIDDCASAKVGDVFQVDFVIQDVKDLLAWEAPISYDPKVLKITDRNVKLFQAANDGSNVFDASNVTPNTSGLFRAGAVDQADPASPDSGSGVLMRLTMEAVADGQSPVSVSPVDLDGDSKPETGVGLKNQDNELIGGQPFSGKITNATIRVGSDCPDGGKVVLGSGGSSSGDNGGNPAESSSGSSNTWVYVVVAAAAAVVVLAGVALLFRRSRRTNGPPSA